MFSPRCKNRVIIEARYNGLLGPITRAALGNYQRDNGLSTTEAIDQPTLRSLGMS